MQSESRKVSAQHLDRMQLEGLSFCSLIDKRYEIGTHNTLSSVPIWNSGEGPKRR
jgi:hypothetical protein